MQNYNITGMSCAACSARVEKVVSKLPGVSSCAVSLLTNSMTVEGTASSSDIIAAVEGAGYGASLRGAENKGSRSSSVAEYEEMLTDKETPKLKRRRRNAAGQKTEESAGAGTKESESTDSTVETPQPKRKRGRPKKEDKQEIKAFDEFA